MSIVKTGNKSCKSTKKGLKRTKTVADDVKRGSSSAITSNDIVTVG